MSHPSQSRTIGTAAPARSDRVFSILEWIAVYAGGTVLGFLIAKIAGYEIVNPLVSLAERPEQDLRPLAIDLLGILFWQYLGWLVCIAGLRLARGRLMPLESEPAIPQRRRLSPGKLLFFGLVVGCLASIPQHAINLVQTSLGIGETAAWRTALLDRSWDADFWLFMAIGSFGLIPFVEELFHRGWVLNRLRHAWGPGLAVLLSSSAFAFSHGQYLQWDLLNVLTLLSVTFAGLLYALAVLHCRSLWPAIIAHVMINVPTTQTIELIALLTMLVFVIASFRHWKALLESAVALKKTLRLSHAAGALAFGALLAVALQSQQELLAVAGLALWLVLLIVHGLRRVFRRRAAPAAAAAASSG